MLMTKFVLGGVGEKLESRGGKPAIGIGGGLSGACEDQHCIDFLLSEAREKKRLVPQFDQFCYHA